MASRGVTMGTSRRTLELLAILFLLRGVASNVGSHDAFFSSDAIADVMEFLQWQDTIFIHDSAVSSEQRHKMLTTFADRKVAVICHQLSDAENSVTFPSLTSFIRNMSSSFVLLYIHHRSATHLLKEAKAAHILHPSYQWLVIWNGTESHVSHLERILCCSPSNVALMTPVTSPQIDVIDDAKSRLDEKLGENKTLRGNPSLKPEVAGPHGNTTFALRSYCLEQSMFCDVATWTSASRLRVFNDVIYPDTARFFSSAPLRIGTLQTIPFTKRENRNGTVVYDGFCFAIVNAMAKYLNFTYEVTEPPDGRFGYKDENGSWAGMVGMLVRGELDLAVGPFSITSDRMEAVDFTVLYMEDGGGILTKKDDSTPSVLNVFRPFPASVWLMIAGVVVVAAIVLNITTKFSTFTFDRDDSRKSQQEPWSLKECVLMIFGSLMTQGVSRHPETCSGRVVLGCWWVFCILIVSMYTASLAALLTVTVHSNVNSIHDLAASSLLPITITGGYWWTSFMKSESAVYRTVASRMAEAPHIAVREEGLALVYAGRAAYIADMNVVRFLQAQDCINLHLAATGFNTNGLGFALPKNAYYKEAMNSIILKLQEGGFLAMWEKEWWRGSTECFTSSSTTSSAHQLEVVSIGGILIAYILVIALALLALTLQGLLPPILAAVRQFCKGRHTDHWGEADCHNGRYRKRGDDEHDDDDDNDDEGDDDEGVQESHGWDDICRSGVFSVQSYPDGGQHSEHMQSEYYDRQKYQKLKNGRCMINGQKSHRKNHESQEEHSLDENDHHGGRKRSLNNGVQRQSDFEDGKTWCENSPHVYDSCYADFGSQRRLFCRTGHQSVQRLEAAEDGKDAENHPDVAIAHLSDITRL